MLGLHTHIARLTLFPPIFSFFVRKDAYNEGHTLDLGYPSHTDF